MDLKLFFIKFVVALIIILIVDGIWLGYISKKFYLKEMSSFSMTENGSLKARIYPIVFIYLLMAFGFAYFINIASGFLFSNFLKGAFFGLVLYGVYDLTNHALIKEFSLKLVLVDMLWGSILFGIVSLISGLILK